MEPDGGYALETEKFRGLKPTMPGKKHPILIDQHRHGEAVDVNVIGDVADLLFRMRARITRVA